VPKIRLKVKKNYPRGIMTTRRKIHQKTRGGGKTPPSNHIPSEPKAQPTKKTKKTKQKPKKKKKKPTKKNPHKNPWGALGLKHKVLSAFFCLGEKSHEKLRIENGGGSQ